MQQKQPSCINYVKWFWKKLFFSGKHRVEWLIMENVDLSVLILWSNDFESSDSDGICIAMWSVLKK